MKNAGAILAIIGALLLWGQMGDSGAPDPPDPIAGDVLAESYLRDRTARIELLKELSTEEFDSDGDKRDYHNEESRRILRESFAAWLEVVAEAIEYGKLPELIEALEASR